MKVHRKLKKRVIKVFGRGTYKGIVDEYLALRKYSNNCGVITKYTDKELKYPLFDHQFNPYLNFPNIN